jgi:hypothetical protein
VNSWDAGAWPAKPIETNEADQEVPFELPLPWKRSISRTESGSGWPTTGQTTKNLNREIKMEKQLSTIGYWLGLICTVLALIFRMFTALKMVPPFMAAVLFPT